MKDLTGQLFGKLTAISPVGKDKHGQYKWLCSCECGNTKEALMGNLVRGRTLTCGCSGKRYQRRPDGEAAFTEVYGRYRAGARTRGYDFNLTEEEFRELAENLCHYCGAEKTNKASTFKSTGFYHYNGIDRKDNTKGYSVENCVPCCYVCNRAKNNMPYNDFVAWLNNLLEFNKETRK